MKRINLLLLLLPFVMVMVSCKDELIVREVESSLGIDIEFSEDDYKPGTTVWGSNRDTRFIVGDYDCPIILASPHDGVKIGAIPGILDSIRIRRHSSATIVRDIYVTELAEYTADSLKKLTGLRPHVIINEVTRSRVEPNRELADAYHTHKRADTIWTEYHNFMKIARKLVKRHVGKGFLLDLHGHGHTKQSTEVGFLLTRNDLNNTDESIDYMAHKSSIRSLGERSTLRFSQLINGDAAFGTFMANYNCPSFPSKQDPRPGSNSYFNGGYCTSIYGSRTAMDGIDAIQLETPGSSASSMRGSAANRRLSGGRMARAIIDYTRVNYGIDMAK